jgi:hypothetical protein
VPGTRSSGSARAGVIVVIGWSAGRPAGITVGRATGRCATATARTAARTVGLAGRIIALALAARRASCDATRGSGDCANRQPGAEHVVEHLGKEVTAAARAETLRIALALERQRKNAITDRFQGGASEQDPGNLADAPDLVEHVRPALAQGIGVRRAAHPYAGSCRGWAGPAGRALGPAPAVGGCGLACLASGAFNSPGLGSLVRRNGVVLPGVMLIRIVCGAAGPRRSVLGAAGPRHRVWGPAGPRRR